MPAHACPRRKGGGPSGAERESDNWTADPKSRYLKGLRTGASRRTEKSCSYSNCSIPFPLNAGQEFLQACCSSWVLSGEGLWSVPLHSRLVFPAPFWLFLPCPNHSTRRFLFLLPFPPIWLFIINALFSPKNGATTLPTLLQTAQKLADKRHNLTK